VGETDRSKAVEGLVRHYRAPGESLESIARNLGVSQIVEEDLPFEGGIYVRETTLVIKLNSLSLPVRRRFTLAHEIGHLMLSAKLKAATRCSRNPNLEDACDAIAAELLMPAEEVVPFVKRQGESSPEKLRLIAEAFGVSLHVAALRVHEDFKLWRRSIGLWHFQGSARELWFVGKRRWRTTRPPFRAFEDALMSSTAIEARESFWEEGSVKPVCIELLSLGNQHLLGLVA
jgi:hypothetical protein